MIRLTAIISLRLSEIGGLSPPGLQRALATMCRHLPVLSENGQQPAASCALRHLHLSGLTCTLLTRIS